MKRAVIQMLVAVVVLGAMVPLALAAPPSAEDMEFFEKEVRPVLAQRCFKCHGDDKEVKGGLRLTSREAVLAGGASGPAAVPGKPEKSALVEAINYNGLEMPPDKQLGEREIASLSRWIALGLPWPQVFSDPPAGTKSTRRFEITPQQRQHWSFQPVAEPAIPDIKDTSWPKTAIDRFVLAKLDERGLRPSPPADPRTWLRRVTFDLTGLPPTSEELNEFLRQVSASSPQDAETRRHGDAEKAYAAAIERLLASPHYGERWGRHWLDVARYADTKGYVLFEEGDYPWAYTYRDYVIRAFNEDLPYDQFILQQLAADQLLQGEDRRPLAALGFLTLGNRFMNNQQDVNDDRIDVTMRGLLGLTVSCARCHDHKFDPIPSADYYSLYGVFASTVEPTVPPLFQPPPQTEEYAAFEKELRAREQKLADYVAKKYDELMQGARKRVAEYLLTAQQMRDLPSTEEFMLIADGNDLNPAMLIRYKAYLERTEKKHDSIFAPWHALSAIRAEQFSEKAPEVIAGLSSFAPRKNVLSRSERRQSEAHPLIVTALVEKPPKTLAEVAERFAEVLLAADLAWQDSVRVARDAHLPPPARLEDPDLESLRQVFYGPDAPASVPRSPIGDLALLPDRPSQNERNKLLKEVEQWRATGKGAPPRAMALEEVLHPVEPYVFLRGNPNNHGPAVPRQFPEILSRGERRPFQRGSGRLELAQAIVERSNPLTARVMANRIWLHHFGAGLVKTPGDFGLRSEPPSHPELLDYLATRLVESGWSIKTLHREILRSAVYAQRSDDRPECRSVNPENMLLWKMNRRRLDFESTRDALLAVAGRLNHSIGGPPMKDFASSNNTRRTVYGFVDRLNLPGLLRTFDFPSPDATAAQRDTTTIAPQALFLMNSPLVIGLASELLNRPEIVAATQSDAKIARLYELLYAREVSQEELLLAREYLGELPSSSKLWQQYAQSLLLANEFVFVD